MKRVNLNIDLAQRVQYSNNVPNVIDFASSQESGIQAAKPHTRGLTCLSTFAHFKDRQTSASSSLTIRDLRTLQIVTSLMRQEKQYAAQLEMYRVYHHAVLASGDGKCFILDA